MQPKGFEPLASVESGQHSTTELRLQPIFSNVCNDRIGRNDHNTDLLDDLGNNRTNQDIFLANNNRNNSICGMDYMDTFFGSFLFSGKSSLPNYNYN